MLEIGEAMALVGPHTGYAYMYQCVYFVHEFVASVTEKRRLGFRG